MARAPSPPGGSFRKQPKDASLCLAPAGSISLGATLKFLFEGGTALPPADRRLAGECIHCGTLTPAAFYP